MALIDKASLLMVPSTYEAGTLYNVLPSGNRAPDSTDQNSGYDQTRADFTFDRGSNAAATRIGSDGLIKKYRENLLVQSNNFGTTWVKGGTTLTSGQSGYDGTNNAWLLSKGAASYTRITQDIAKTGVHSVSVYAKANTLNKATIYIFAAGDDPFAIFNLVDGSVVSSGSIIGSNATSVGNDWWRLSITFNATTQSINFYPDFSESTAGSIFIQSAQLETSMVATDYLDSGATTAKAGVLIDLPRINYDANGENGSLLLEPQRLNSVENSEYFNGTDWSKGNITIESNSIISPDGLLNASKLIENTANDRHSLTKSFSTSATNNTISAFFKKGTRRYASIVTSDTTYWNTMVVVDLEDGSITKEYNRSGITSTNSVEDYGNGWYRLITSVNGAPSGSTLYARFTIQDSATPSNPPSNSYQGDGVSGIYIWGAQVENNASYATSYIPNMGESGGVTRAADSCLVTGVSDVIGQTEGTLFFDYETGNAQENGRLIAIGDGGTSNRILLRNQGSGTLLYVAAGGSSTWSTTYYTPGNTGRIKIALAYANNDGILFVNGSSVNSDTNVTVPACSNVYIGTSEYGGSESVNMLVHDVTLFKERLTNSELATLTTL